MVGACQGREVQVQLLPYKFNLDVRIFASDYTLSNAIAVEATLLPIRIWVRSRELKQIASRTIKLLAQPKQLEFLMLESFKFGSSESNN